MYVCVSMTDVGRGYKYGNEKYNTSAKWKYGLDWDEIRILCLLAEKTKGNPTEIIQNWRRNWVNFSSTNSEFIQGF